MCKRDEEETPIILFYDDHLLVCSDSETHVYIKVKRTGLWILILTTQCIDIQIIKLLSELTKFYHRHDKFKGGRYSLGRRGVEAVTNNNGNTNFGSITHTSS